MAEEEVALAPVGALEAVNPNENANPNPGNQFWPMLKSIASRIFMFYIISSVIRYTFKGNQEAPSTNVSQGGKVYPPSMNMFRPGEIFDMYFYLSPKSEKFRDFENQEAFFWHEQDLMYGDWSSGEEKDGSRSKHVSMPTPLVLQNNGSLYLHVFAVKSGRSPVPRDQNYGGREVVYGSVMLNKFKKKHYKRTANLLTGKTGQTEVEQQKADEIKFEVLNFWHENITVNLVNDYTAWSRGQLPSPLDEAVKFDPATNQYYPILFFNTYWNLGSEYQPINETVPFLYASQQMRGKWSQMLGSEMFEQDSGDDDQDAIKQALLETNPVLLGVTVVVSILHTVLEFLAFKNDIQFWRTRKSLEGLSVRSVLFNVFQSVIVFLYICDNDSSWVIKMSIGFGLLIEMWKIPKCLNVEFNHEEKWFGIIPKVKFSDKGSYVESATKAYDQLAFKYLSWVLFPLLGGYAVYSLIYEEQRGWYSWILGMLYGFLLMFGFIMMTPSCSSITS
uniref:Cleft lip and palate associated transmembrane protein n=1 Tax=Ditylenchus dipsaci TaxID=166011 RepID=A0A915DAJ4_9BILA